MKSMLQQSKISIKNIHQDIFPKTPTHPCTYIEKFYHIVSHYPEHLHVFTDGLKDHSRTVCAAILKK